MSEKTNLRQMFEAREMSYKKATDRILEMMASALDAIVTFLASKGELSGTQLVWQEASYYPSSDEGHEGYIMLMGVIEHLVGQKFQLPNGQMVEVTEETADYFRRIIRIGIPLKLAVEGTEQEILQFMEETTKEDFEEGPGFDSAPQPDTFDMDELTEEQKQALAMFSGTSGTKN